MQKSKRKVKNFILNLSLSFLSFILIILFLEFVVFRFIFPASDIPENAFIDGIIKFKPNQSGIFREKNEVRTKFRINSNGWNSIHKKYRIHKNKRRIAIIGDSYVEALMVDYDKSLAERIEKLSNYQFEVYRFGISGAPLSQYYYMLKKEVLQYKPDIVVFILVHNDFDESWRYKYGRYTSCFLKLKILKNGNIIEIPPSIYKEKWYDFIRKSAIFRFLYYREKVNMNVIKNILRKNNVKYQANIQINDLKIKMKNNYLVTDYILKKIKEISEKNGFKVLFVMDGDRNSIYKNLPDEKLYKNGALMLNLMVKKITHKYQLPFIDLHPIFKKDYKKYHHKFNYNCDFHWNEYGHNIVAKHILNYIEKNKWFKIKYFIN